MAYTIIVKPAAKRDIKKLDRDVQRRVLNRIEELADDPRPPGCEKLKGADDLYRVRLQDWRIVYAIEDRAVKVVIVRVGHRRDVYRKQR